MKRLFCLILTLSLSSCGIFHEISAAEGTRAVELSAKSETMAADFTIAELPPDTTARESEAEPIPEPEKPLIYLTFDDGPGKYTEDILKTLAEYDVQATFFMTGMFVDYYPERVKMAADAGHTIACHSWSHDYHAIYESTDTIAADLEKWEASIEEALGYVPEEKLYRFPGGSNCTTIDDYGALHEAVTDAGYRCFDWTCANNDRWLAGKPDDMELTDFLKQSVIDSLALCGDTRIMLMHDTSSASAAMLAWTLEYLMDAGYSFATLDEFEGEYTFMGGQDAK